MIADDNQCLICVFPYIELSKPLLIRGETLYPISLLESISFTSSIMSMISEIQQFFFWYNNQLVSNITFAILPEATNSKRRHQFMLHVDEIRKLLGFLCCQSDERPETFYLQYHYEQADYYLFMPQSLVAIEYMNCIAFDQSELAASSRFRNGYRYYFNQDAQADVVPGCRIYPSSRDVKNSFSASNALQHYESVTSQVNIIPLINDDVLSPTQEDRVFNALEWFNRSCKANITSDLSLVYLAVAFETLLGRRRDEERTDKSAKKHVLYDAMRLPLGDIPRFEEWLLQFYDARSRILHEGSSSELRFRNPEKDGNESHSNEYGYLTHYGMLVFRICIGSKVAGLATAARMDFKTTFFTHQERLERIAKTLSETENTYNALDNVIDDVKALSRYPWIDSSVKFETLWKVARLLAKIILELEVPVTAEQSVTLKAIVGDHDPVAIIYSDVIVRLTILLFENQTDLAQVVRDTALQELTSEPPPSVSKIRRKIEEILDDKRNRNISESTRMRLQTIKEISDYCIYESKLRMLSNLHVPMRDDVVTKYDPFTIISAYAGFLPNAVGMYMRQVRYSMEYNEAIFQGKPPPG